MGKTGADYAWFVKKFHLAGGILSGKYSPITKFRVTIYEGIKAYFNVNSNLLWDYCPNDPNDSTAPSLAAMRQKARWFSALDQKDVVATLEETSKSSIWTKNSKIAWKPSKKTNR